MAQTGYTPIQLYTSVTATNVPLSSNLLNGELAINITDGKLFYKDNSGVVQTLITLAHGVGNYGDITGSITVAKGTTAQQPGSPATGMMRYNSTTNQFEGYSGASPAWKSIGGSALTNDTSTSSTLYPVFAGSTTGTAENLYTSNAKLLYKPSTGELSASTPIASNGIFVNNTTISASMTIDTGTNGFSIGPMTLATGQLLTIASGQRHVIL